MRSEVRFAAYREYTKKRTEGSNALMALLAGAQMTSHLLKLTDGSEHLLPDIFPSVPHIRRFNLSTDQARGLLNAADEHLGAMSVPYVLAIHEDYLRTCLTLLAQDQIWRASLTVQGLGELKPWLTRDKISPTPYFLNGIVATPDGRTLLVGEQGQDLTYRVDIRIATAKPVEVTGANGILSGDGYLLEGHHLYVVYNAGGGRYVTRLARLDSTWSKAEVIGDSAPGAAGSTPTTVARDRGRLLWVNSQLDVAPGTPPHTLSGVPGLR